MKHFSEQMRYDYPLDCNSVVVDAGGYQGNWFAEMFRRYGCSITVYEPGYQFFLQCSIVAHELNPGCDRINVLRKGLGRVEEDFMFLINGDSTGMYCNNGSIEKVHIADVNLELGHISPVDVLKLNIEGMEFDVLEALTDSGLIQKIKNIQVQFHNCVPDYKVRYKNLQDALRQTHEQEWDSAPLWENWRLK